MCRKLVDGGAPSLHVYTLNRAKATQAVLARLH
jgi:methylenetetrahydrofolate reductase (NADPH)